MNARTHAGTVRTTADGAEAVLEAEQWLPRPPTELFPFFADAFNLERITPPWLRFQVLTQPPIEMGKGTRIAYRLRLHGIPVRWTSTIKVWDPPRRFVDEQDSGPYRSWHHEHRFLEDNGGTTLQDTVRYRAPGGRLVHNLYVSRAVGEIFHYRQSVLAELFGE